MISGAEIDLDTAGKEEVYLPRTGDRYLLTDRNCSDQTGHGDFKVQESRSPSFFVLPFLSEP